MGVMILNGGLYMRMLLILMFVGGCAISTNVGSPCPDDTGGAGGSLFTPDPPKGQGWVNVCRPVGPFVLGCNIAANPALQCAVYGSCCKVTGGVCVARCLACCGTDGDASLVCM